MANKADHLEENRRVRRYLHALERVHQDLEQGRAPAREDLWPLRAFLAKDAAGYHEGRAAAAAIPTLHVQGDALDPWLRRRLATEHGNAGRLVADLAAALDRDLATTPRLTALLSEYVACLRFTLRVEDEALHWEPRKVAA